MISVFVKVSKKFFNNTDTRLEGNAPHAHEMRETASRFFNGSVLLSPTGNQRYYGKYEDSYLNLWQRVP